MSSKKETLRDQIAEASEIRSKLRLRWNQEYGCYEVYTTIHGTGVFKWLKVREGIAMWYKNRFGLKVEDEISVKIDASISGVKELEEMEVWAARSATKKLNV